MAPINRDLPRASFDEIEFPFTSRDATLEARTHTHEYPKQAGGSVEKLGRKLWMFSFEVPFHTTFPNYPDLYPGRLRLLTERCARLDTAALVVPEIGTLRCILTKIQRKRQGRIHSGEDCSLQFLEDDLEPFRRTTTPASRASLDEAAEQVRLGQVLLVDSDLTAATIKARTDLDALLSLTDSLAAIRDTTTLYGLQIQGRLAQIEALSRSVHELLKGPDLDPLRRGLRSLWAAASTLRQDLTGDGGDNVVRTYIVTSPSSVSQIAQRLYQDASRGGEVLALNRGLADPYLVTPGTRLTVYAR